MLPPKELAPLLCLMLTLLTIHAPSTTQAKVEAPLRPLLQALEVDHDVPSELSSAVMDLFGEVESGAQLWRADVSRMVAEVGRGLLAVLNPSGNTGSQGRSLDAFISEWREQVGETWQESTELKLLEVSTSTHNSASPTLETILTPYEKGDFLLNLPLSTTSHLGATIVPFSNHSLPLHPATRFADLFLTRPRWRPDEMAPFLRGLTRDGDTKERDKLVAKFVRVVKEKGGVWWYPRRTS